MRALVLSDIHNKIEPIHLLRTKERNEFDMILVGGDIGCEIAKEFCQILDSFSCPTFCVYGNWDGDLDYTTQLSRSCVLVHHAIHECGGYFVTGFSGCPTYWGKNPFHLEEDHRLRDRHTEILSALADAEHAGAIAEKVVAKECRKKRQRLYVKTPDRKTKAYRERRHRIELWQEREVKRIREGADDIRSSKAFAQYLEDRSASGRRTLTRNRDALVNLINRSGIDQRRLIIMTHERLYRLEDDGISPLLHVFGHIHEYKHTKFKGTSYLNAAAIDTSHIEFFDGRQPLPNGYCRVTIANTTISVERRLLYDELSGPPPT
jgi:Icc-related predicted phosphoesterase